MTGRDGRSWMLVCIDRNNLDRMLADHPLVVDMTGFEGVTQVVVAYKEHLEDFVGELVTGGIVSATALEEIQGVQPGEERTIHVERKE